MRAPLAPPDFVSWPLSDGYLLNGRLWRPRGQASDTAILYLHGIQSHGGWFEWSASLLAAQRCAVLLPDRRGSGLNDALRGDVPAALRWRHDLDEIAANAEQQLGARRFALVGVSWGAKVAIDWALHNPKRAAAVLLIGPGLFPSVGLPLATRARVAGAAGLSPRSQFPIPLDDPALFTDSPAGQQFIADDPLKLTTATARFLWHSTLLDFRLRRLAAGALRTPLTVVLAGRDRIIDNTPTEAWARRIAGRGCAIRRLESEMHTPEFSESPQPFTAVLQDWLGAIG